MRGHRPAGSGRYSALAQFAVYVIHLPILVFVQMAAEHTGLGPLALAMLTGTTALFLCYWLAALYGLVQGAAAAGLGVRRARA